MKKAFQNSGSFLMALLVLFSTMSFTVEKHFCGSILVDKAIFSEAKSCGMESHNTSSTEEMEKDSCCKEVKTMVEGQKELKISFEKFDFQQQLFLTTFTYSYLNLFESLPAQVIPFKDYSPPLLVTDIQLVDQVFLI